MRKSLFTLILLLVFSVAIPLQITAGTNDDTNPEQGTIVTDENKETNKSTESNTSVESEDKEQNKPNDTANDSEQDITDTPDEKKDKPDKTADTTNDEQQEKVADPSKEVQQRVTDKDQKQKAKQDLEKSSKTMQSSKVKKAYMKSAISKVGRIQRIDAKIYETIGGKGFKAGPKYTDRTFYIRKQAKGDGDTYYLISTRRSATNGVIGWVDAEEMRVQSHSTVASNAKTLYLDGTGWAYRTPWGASKDVLINNLSPYTYNVLKVNLTEKVGGYIWYRGTLNGTTVWVQGYNAEAAKESPVSKVGRVQIENAIIYKTFGNSGPGVKAGEKYTEKLYYIKNQMKVFGEIFYQLRENPGSGVAGWVNAKDVRAQQYSIVNQDSKTLYLDGTGWSYTDPWGGAQDVVNTNLTPYKYLAFDVTRKVRIGNYSWYRGTLDGKTVWIQGNNFLYKPGYNESNTSKIGRINNPNTIIYKDLNAGSSMKKTGSRYSDTVVYIKKQAKVSNRLYYLISTQRSSSVGVIGWVQARDIRTQSHRVIDTNDKTLYLDGTGWSYTDPWGGSKDIVNKDLTPYKQLKFKINRTEKVGKYIWYRGDLNGKTVWIMGNNFMEVDIEKSSTSKIGRIQNANTNVYGDIMQGTSLSKAGSRRTDKIFYIKKQAKFNNQLFYMISNRRSSTKGVVGWVKSEDIREQSHSVANEKNFNYYLDGTGWTYSDPWGGAKDVISKELTKGDLIKVTRTEQIGDFFWYKGNLNGKTVWIQAFNVIAPKFNKIKRVGRINDLNAIIYQTIGDNANSFNANNKYTQMIVYIKRKAEIFDQTYYRISNKRNSSVVGWIKAEDIRSQSHTRVDSKNKSFFLDGTGWAYSDPWGGKKDVIYNDLSQFKEVLFEVNLTEKVGDYTWYRGTLDGKTVWIMSYNVIANLVEKTTYDLTLEKMLDIQTSLRHPGPQTDQGKYAWVSGAYITNGKVTADVLNVRRGPISSTNHDIIGQLLEGTSVTIVDKMDGWVAIKVPDDLGWGFAAPEDVRYYLNPNNFTDTLRGKLQFLNLSSSANINANEVNSKILRDKGILKGRARTFIKAGRTHGINEIYLISHALLETGNGASTLATGVPVDKSGNITRNSKGDIAKTSKTVAVVYNMYGVGAVDGDALAGGAKYAFDHGWTTPSKAIIGGAAFVSNGYVGEGQGTLYEMRWNPLGADRYGYATHQYATDIAWAYKQTYRMNTLYKLLTSYNLVFDIPVYR